jgi:hypothetical protein
VIGAAAVHDDQLIVAAGLLNDGFDGFGQEMPVVVIRNDNTEEGIAHEHFRKGLSPAFMKSQGSPH